MNPKDRKALEMAREALEVCKAEDVARDVLRRKALALIDERLQADEKETNPERRTVGVDKITF